MGEDTIWLRKNAQKRNAKAPINRAKAATKKAKRKSHQQNYNHWAKS
jgi:hypothetical protein